MLGTIRMCIVWLSGAMIDESLVGLVLDGVFVAVIVVAADLDDLLPNNVELPSDLLNDVLFVSWLLLFSVYWDAIAKQMKSAI